MSRLCLSLPLLALSGLLASCAAQDYSDGIGAFSQAVNKVDGVEQALVTSEQTVRLSQWTEQVGGKPPTTVYVDLGKCIASATYKSGDCVVQSATFGPAPTTPRPSSMGTLKAYAEQLSAVASDKTCAALQADAKDLSAKVADLAPKVGGAGSAAGPVATIASTVGCWEIAREQLSILRNATQAADPLIQALVVVIADKDQNLADAIVEERVRKLSLAVTAYQTGAGSLQGLIGLAAEADQAHADSPQSAIKAIAALHQELRDDLQKPKVDLARVERNAQAILADAQTLQTSIKALK